MNSNENKQTGRAGEDTACRYLREKGYTILMRNYTVRYGEIDIIARTADTVVFVEVKTRRDSGYIRACEAVSKSKQRRLIAAASMWLAANDYNGDTRFDVIEVYSDGAIEHIEHAFWLS